MAERQDERTRGMQENPREQQRQTAEQHKVRVPRKADAQPRARGDKRKQDAARQGIGDARAGAQLAPGGQKREHGGGQHDCQLQRETNI